MLDTPGALPAPGRRFLIPGPAGHIEAELAVPKGEARVDAVAIVCHPHPLYGGSLTNKVVHTVARSFNELGVISLRFNFRGVGDSQGRFDDGVGETDDLHAVADWLRQRYPVAALWLAGFSFGAYVAFRAQSSLRPARLLLVAPPVSKWAFPEARVLARWMVIQGGQDEVIDPRQVSDWVSRQSPAPEYRWLAGAGHFFHGQLVVLRDLIGESWREP